MSGLVPAVATPACYAGRPRPDSVVGPDPQREIRVYDAAMALVIRMVEEMPVILSGDRPVDTEPVAELSRALATLLRGQLYPPPGTLWCFGRPGGRMTMPLPGTATDG